MYPPHVVEKLSSDLGDIADHHPSVSVLMCDIVGFTDWCSHTPPNRVIECLSAYFQILDDLAEKCGIYKVRRASDHTVSQWLHRIHSKSSLVGPFAIIARQARTEWAFMKMTETHINKTLIVSHARPLTAAPLLPHPHRTNRAGRRRERTPRHVE